jgi:hypothetical protein
VKTGPFKLLRGIVFAFLLTAVHSASAFYDPTLGRWASRDPIGEHSDKNLFSFVRNNPLNSFDPDGRLTISVEKEATVTKCGGWEQGEWKYVMGAQYSHDVYWVQKVTLEEQFHLDCKSAKNPVYHKYEVHYEAFKFTATSIGLWSWKDGDTHGGHGSDTFGDHTISVEAKIIKASDYPEVEQWPTDNARAAGMYTTRNPPTWWDSVTALETGSRTSTRTWACCCSKYEGPWKHTP